MFKILFLAIFAAFGVLLFFGCIELAEYVATEIQNYR